MENTFRHFELLQSFSPPTKRHIQLVLRSKWYSAFKNKEHAWGPPLCGRNHGNNAFYHTEKQKLVLT